MSCPDLIVIVDRTYLPSSLHYRICHLRFLYSPIPQAGTQAPVGFPATGYEDMSVDRNVFKSGSPSLPHVMKTRLRAGMCSRVTHHLCHTSGRHE